MRRPRSSEGASSTSVVIGSEIVRLMVTASVHPLVPTGTESFLRQPHGPVDGGIPARLALHTAVFPWIRRPMPMGTCISFSGLENRPRPCLARFFRIPCIICRR